jgi:CubicO group peptidase (beta-lactamase class C family)
MAHLKISKTPRAVIKPLASILALFALALLSACLAGSEGRPSPSYWPTQGWHTSAPEEQGFDSAKLAEGLLVMQEQNINIHSLMIIRNDDVILDAYFYPYDGETVHELASVTKSVMTILIAIAADQGKLRLDQPMVSFFPDRTIANRDALKERITVRHLAAMTSGLDCTAANDEQTLDEMGLSPDWVQFTLDREVANEPGKHFEYCSPGMRLLSAILQEATGMTSLEFARLNLFDPLGIQDVLWDVDPQGYNDGWAGLYLHPSDVAKLGLLWLYGGQWEGKQIVSRSWVEESVKRQTITGMGDDYGYGWWVMPGDQGEYAAEGRSGQYIRVFPAWNAIVVTTGGGFDWNDIAPFIASAVADMAKPLPANPAGVDELNAALAAVQRPPAPELVPPLPEAARAISGKTFVLESDPLNLRTLRLDFDNSAEARIQLTFTNQPDRDFKVGLDGIYRTYPFEDYDLPMGLRGGWLDAQTFLLEYDRIANRDAYLLHMRFESDRVMIEVKERTRQASVTFEGKLLTP